MVRSIRGELIDLVISGGSDVLPHGQLRWN